MIYFSDTRAGYSSPCATFSHFWYLLSRRKATPITSIPFDLERLPVSYLTLVQERMSDALMHGSCAFDTRMFTRFAARCALQMHRMHHLINIIFWIFKWKPDNGKFFFPFSPFLYLFHFFSQKKILFQFFLLGCALPVTHSLWFLYRMGTKIRPWKMRARTKQKFSKKVTFEPTQIAKNVRVTCA